jgi:hypothetical protein
LYLFDEKTIKKQRKTTIKRFFYGFFGKKNKNKVFCWKIDDFLNIFGFLAGYADVFLCLCLCLCLKNI